MTITRLWQGGIETGDLSEFDSADGTAAASGAVVKTGSYSLSVPPGNWNGGNVNFTGTRQVRVGFNFYIVNTANSSEVSLFCIKDGSANLLVDIRYTLPLGGADIRLYTGGTLRDTDDEGLDTGAWFHIGIDVFIDSSAGWVKVYKDGIEILSYTGNTGNADMVIAHFGHQNAYINNSTKYYDDMFIDDTTDEVSATTVPIKYFQPLIANGNGNYSNWVGSDADSTDNYALVDETPANGDTDFVQATSADVLDSYAMSTYTLQASESCVALIPYVTAKQTGSTERIALGTRYSSTDVVGDDQDPGISYSVLFERQITKPGGGNWTQTAIDGVEVVIKSRGTY